MSDVNEITLSSSVMPENIRKTHICVFLSIRYNAIHPVRIKINNVWMPRNLFDTDIPDTNEEKLRSIRYYLNQESNTLSSILFVMITNILECVNDRDIKIDEIYKLIPDHDVKYYNFGNIFTFLRSLGICNLIENENLSIITLKLKHHGSFEKTNFANILSVENSFSDILKECNDDVRPVEILLYFN